MDKILFLEKDGLTEKIFYIDRIEEVYSIKLYLKHLAEDYLIDINSYNRLARKKIGLKNNIPLYISNDFLFFHMNENGKEYYINYKEMLGVSYYENECMILFNGGYLLKLHINHNRLIYALQKCTFVLEYLTRVKE